MTVKELIDKLSACDPNAEVVTQHHEYGRSALLKCSGVQQIKAKRATSWHREYYESIDGETTLVDIS